jgi:predicted dehydrogenase
MIADFMRRRSRPYPGLGWSLRTRAGRTNAGICRKQACEAANSIEELVQNPAIHVACVTTPSGAHAEARIPFLKGWKAVLCEKPLEVSIDAVDRILAAEKEGGGF